MYSNFVNHNYESVNNNNNWASEASPTRYERVDKKFVFIGLGYWVDLEVYMQECMR